MHIVGQIRPITLLTEGPVKAYVIHALTGLTVIAAPGVNILTQLEKTLTQMRKEGLCGTKTAFDMDMSTNHHVQNLISLPDKMNFKFGTYVRDPRYKGLDDYIREYCFRRRHSK